MYQSLLLFLLSTLSINGIARSQELSENYESKTAIEKQSEIWDIMLADDRPMACVPNIVEFGLGLLFDDLSLSFEHYKDYLPYDHVKRIHTTGGVAKAIWRNTGNHSYTGLFQSESNPAIVRMSLADTTFIPGISVKLFRDGMESANFAALHALERQGGRNFFQETFSNHIAQPTQLHHMIAFYLFGRVSQPAEMIGISDFATHNQTGVEVEEPRFPYRLKIKPEVNLTNSYVDGDSVKDQLTSIKNGTLIYHVYALDTPDVKGDGEKIGEIVTESDMIYSAAGDKFLFFRHQRIEDDFALRPDFVPKDSRRSRQLTHPCPQLRRLMRDRL